MTALADGTAASPIASFLEWEEQQPERWERVGGVVRMMTGGTLAHDYIGNNIKEQLRRRLRGGPCTRHGSDVKVITPHEDVLYPDVFVRCSAMEPGALSVRDPIVIFEVLSTSTAQHDLTRKRLAYKTIPSLKVVVYVAQDRARLDVVRRQADGRWDDDEPVVGIESELALPEIGVALAMAEIYEDIEVEAA